MLQIVGEEAIPRYILTDGDGGESKGCEHVCPSAFFFCADLWCCGQVQGGMDDREKQASLGGWYGEGVDHPNRRLFVSLLIACMHLSD